MNARSPDQERLVEELTKRVSELEAQVKSLLNDKDLLRPQWEYHNFWHVNLRQLENGDIQKMLNDMGQNGWEVVCCSVLHPQGAQSSTFYTLKRRKFI